MKLYHSIGPQCSAGIAECFPIGAAIPNAVNSGVSNIDPLLSCWCSTWLLSFLVCFVCSFSCHLVMSPTDILCDLVRIHYGWSILLVNHCFQNCFGAAEIIRSVLNFLPFSFLPSFQNHINLASLKKRRQLTKISWISLPFNVS